LVFKLMAVNMDSPLSQLIKLTCGHTRTTALGAKLSYWDVMPNDRRVNVFPANVIPRHNCPELSVAIQKKSIVHFYIIKDPEIIKK
jgi:hypothetical protein